MIVQEDGKVVLTEQQWNFGVIKLIELFAKEKHSFVEHLEFTKALELLKIEIDLTTASEDLFAKDEVKL